MASARPARAGKLGQLLVAGGFLALVSLVYHETWVTLEAEGAASGGAMDNAAMYPEWLAGALLVLCLIQAVRIVTGVETRSLDDADAAAVGPPMVPAALDAGAIRTYRLKALAAAVAVVAYLLLLKPLGYHIATPLLMAVLFYLLEVRNVLWLVGLALATSIVAALFFEKLLNVVLPVGMFALSL
jgi:hypothetical protein